MSSNQPLNIVLKQLVKCLRNVNEPISIDNLLLLSGPPNEGTANVKRKVKTLLDLAVGLGYVIRCNNHYFASTHAEDVLPFLDFGTETDSNDESAPSSRSSSLSDLSDLNDVSEVFSKPNSTPPS